MNIFVLCTGRCGSTAFVKACSHFTNFTAGHETRAEYVGAERLQYPDRHIEADNRLSWFLGRLDRTFGDNAYYVHLTRDLEEVAESLSKRIDKLGTIGHAYRNGIIIKKHDQQPVPALEAMRDYVETVTENIELFLNGKRNVMKIPLAEAKSIFPQFCDWVAAEGDFAAALKEWDVKHNAGPEITSTRGRLADLMRLARKRA